ncbi:bifunctional diguanylate cyclase/phosphodiesterase [Actinoplanes oblitus]|uniref:Bifunctional diguanylate cyclase/phosphodiesterase n=1 Tax=Actinoplanes oblitus TaxID=3040509 RepID=A0ABY8WJE8_9ACTN|nr:bifunctional diguanylate cyclase/phosphodiesterase [Actinoplanes oblitus]WIM97945.1 bifunctional diguanylate cyclase/phosphodiesterase [Actinoplanes oblitus]
MRRPGRGVHGRFAHSARISADDTGGDRWSRKRSGYGAWLAVFSVARMTRGSIGQPRIRPSLAVLTVVVMVAVVAVAPSLSSALQELMYALTGFGSATVIVVAARRHRHRRAHQPAWLLLAAGLGCGALANTIWGIQYGLGLPGAPRFSVVDVLYFAMYPLLAAALAMLPERPPGSSRWTGWAEAGIVACTGAILAWILLYDPYLIDEGRMPGDAGAVCYPVLDVLLIAMAVRLLVAQRRLTRTHIALLVMAVLLAAADVAYFLSVTLGGAWSGPAPSVMAWLVAFTLPAFAAAGPEPTVGSRTAAGEMGSWRTVLLHGVLVLIGPAATCYALVQDEREGQLNGYDFIVPLSATAAIAVLLVVRMTIAQRQLHRHATSLTEALAEQQQLQRSLRHLADHDALTGLPNRRRLEQHLASPTPRAVLLLDLDDFQDVNDRLGHTIGDQLLLAIAQRLQATLAPGELLARTGGDEFVLLVPAADSPDAVSRANSLLHLLRAPIPVGEHMLHITASIGVRLPDAAADVVHRLGDADLALYAAKAAGKDCVSQYDPAFRTRQTERIRIVERLRHALNAGELTVHFQPIVELDTGTTVAVEALARWLPPGEPPIGPDRFIPAAEDSGLIIALGEWVLRRACADAAPWHRANGVTLTVNVSPRQLADDEFTTKVRAALTDSGLPPTALTLEITEGILVSAGHHSAQALAHLQTLRADGIRIAVDDFGTGYSSLAYLRVLPIDTLKIDRSLMPADEHDIRQLALVRAVIDLARSLDLTTVAEGIETAVQGELLHRIGCDRGQGYHYARPMPAAELAAFTASTVLGAA